MLVRRIIEIAGGASPGTDGGWPSPRASEKYQGYSAEDAWVDAGLRPPAVRNGKRRVGAGTFDTTLSTAARALGQQHWPTANTRDAASAGRHTTTTGVMHPGTTLTDASRLWPTPDASVINDGESPASWRERQAVLKLKGINGNGAGVPLAVRSAEVSQRLWPSARAEDAESAGNHPQVRDSLTGASRGWAGPSDRSGPPPPTTEPAGGASSATTPSSPPPSPAPVQRLNPLFVEWLMNLPQDWTCVCVPGLIDSAASATRSSPSRRKPQFSSSGTARSVRVSAEPWADRMAAIWSSR